jgi:uncharacterized protein YkwD
MGTLSLLSAMVCAHTSLAVEPKTVETYLHEHPTIVSMLQENNRHRASVGLGPQRISPQLTMAAQDHANFMARTGSFSHYSNGGPAGRAQRYGYPYAAAENIAMGQRSVQEAFQSWRSSSGHWANITSGASEAGFGCAYSANGTCYWVGMYGG